MARNELGDINTPPYATRVSAALRDAPKDAMDAWNAVLSELLNLREIRNRAREVTSTNPAVVRAVKHILGED